MVRRKARKPVAFRGFSIAVSPTDPTISPGVIFDYYERFSLDLLEKLVRPGNAVVDVGANIGIFSLIAARCAGPDGFVLALEPEPDNLALLRRNLFANSVECVTVESAAVTDTAGPVRLRIYPMNSGNHCLAPRGAQQSLSRGNFHEVAGVTLANLFERHNLSHIDLIKIDIEGFEPAALSTVPNLSSICSAVMMEYVPHHLLEAGFDPQAFLQELLDEWSIVLRIDEIGQQLFPVHHVGDIDYRFDGNILCLAGPTAPVSLMEFIHEPDS